MNAASLIRQLAASLRYNVRQARADLDQMHVRTRDEFYHQGYQNGRVAVMEALAESLDVLDDRQGVSFPVNADEDGYPLSAVVALPQPDMTDDDGQIWFGDYEIRVDPTGRGPAEVYVGKSAPGLRHLERHAAAILAAVAAARAADAEHQGAVVTPAGPREESDEDHERAYEQREIVGYRAGGPNG